LLVSRAVTIPARCRRVGGCSIPVSQRFPTHPRSLRRRDRQQGYADPATPSEIGGRICRCSPDQVVGTGCRRSDTTDRRPSPAAGPERYR
jgi:hypothetical protein